MMKKILCLLVAALMLFSVAACTPVDGGKETEATTDTGAETPAVTVPVIDVPAETGPVDEGTDADIDAPATEVPADTDAPVDTEPETEPVTDAPVETEAETAAPLNYTTMNDLQKLTTPFWRMDTMDRESTTFIVRDDGTVTAKLAFKPTRIIAVENNALNKTFEEGKDYTWDGETNTLLWVEGSSIPFFTKNDIEGKREDGTQLDAYPTWDELGRSRFGNQLYCVSAFLYEKQIAVTYEYEYGAWEGEVTEYQGDKLPTTMEKLKDGEEVTIFFFGDSIFTGCDSSAMYNRDPQQKSFPEFTKQVLEATYGGRVKLYNPSVGGMQSDWGATEIDKLVCDRAEPDLIFIGFGMNDAFGGRQSAKNVESMINTVRARYPKCEFVILSCMVPNAAAGFLTNQPSQPAAYKALADKTEGVAFVNMYACHKKLLEEKDFISMSGNNINHPNDWLIRVYGMQILSALVKY